MTSIPILFSSLIAIPALIYIYCNWKMLQLISVADLDSGSPSVLSRVERKLFILNIVRMVAPFLTFTGIIWGFIWIVFQHGLLSFAMGCFLISLVLGYFLLKYLLFGLLLLLFIIINPKKR